MIVPGMFVCSSFLISVCMFIVLKSLLILSATVIVCAEGAIWLNPFQDTKWITAQYSLLRTSALTWVLDRSLSHSHFASSEHLFLYKINCILTVIGSPAT